MLYDTTKIGIKEILFCIMMNKMVNKAKKKGTTHMVPNLTGPIVDTHRPQSAVKKIVPAKGLGIGKDYDESSTSKLVALGAKLPITMGWIVLNL